MSDSILSIIIRDPTNLCSPYKSTAHTFFVSIYTCDNMDFLYWKGITYHNYPLNVRGLMGGFIHAQVRVPPGCYLLRSVATCKNVVSDWAWVEVGCSETVCVNLVIPNVIDCIARAKIGIRAGTVDPPEGEDMIMKAMPIESEEADKILTKMIAKLPKSVLPPPPTVGELAELKEKEKKIKEVT